MKAIYVSHRDAGDHVAAPVMRPVRRVMSSPVVCVTTDRAIAAARAHGPESLEAATVRSVVEPEPPVVGEEASVAEAARLMRRTGVDAVAIVDADRRPIGIVTGSDLVTILAG